MLKIIKLKIFIYLFIFNSVFELYSQEFISENNTEIDTNKTIGEDFLLSPNKYYKKFRIDFSLLSGYSQNKIKQLNLFVLEPKLSLTENLSIGLRCEFKMGMEVLKDDPVIFTYGPDNLSSLRYLNTGNAGISKYFLLTGDWHFKPSKKLRPFIGLGVGFANIMFAYNFIIEANKNQTGPIMNEERLYFPTDLISTFFVITPKIGFDFAHMRFNVSYQFCNKGTQEFSGLSTTYIKSGFYSNYNFAITNIVLSNVKIKYLDIKEFSTFNLELLFYIGGGKKNYDESKKQTY